MAVEILRSTDRIETLRKHLKDPIELVWAEPFHQAWIEGEGMDDRVRYARAQKAELIAVKPVIKPGELIIGNNALSPVVTSVSTPFQTGIRLNGQRLESVKADHPDASGRIAEIETYWGAWMAENGPHLPLTCHSSLAWERGLALGLAGMREYVNSCRAAQVVTRPECEPWYEGLFHALDGISGAIEAHARAAHRAAEEADTFERRVELERIASVCQSIAHDRPQSFHEAVQLFYLLFLICGHDSPGPVDRYLYPFLRQDLEGGVICRDEAQEILDCLWLKFEEKSALGATIGGQLPDGSDASNELSLMCVSSIKRLRLLSPRTALRWHPGISPELFRAACDCVASGATYPAFVNDEAVIPAMLERGVSLEHARDYTFVGCGQVYPHGRGHGNYEDVVINSAKPLEWALNNGIDPVSGETRGPATGSPESFQSFDEFEEAYRQQMDHHISESIRSVNERRSRIAGRSFDFLRSLFSYSCVERGLDWHEGGTDYSEGMVDMVGLTTVTDSLIAVKQGVFEEKAITLPRLVEILNRDWKDAEPIRLFFLRRMPKFGNHSDEGDLPAVAEVCRVNEHIKTHKTVFGGPWGMDIIGWSGAVMYGRQTGATPDGRRRGEAVADCAGPAQGRNVCGLTSTLMSTAKLPHRTAHGPLALSLRFPRDVVRGEDGATRLGQVIEVYFRESGQQVQISIASTEDMKAAQRNPEAYESLMVRVGGFSAYFTRLDKGFQDDMIARTELAV